MGVKCQYCGTDNGITHYFGKVCKRCGKELDRREEELKEERKELHEDKFTGELY